MKRIKAVLGLMLAVIMLLTACGGNAAPATEAAAPAEAAKPAEAEAAKPAETEAAVATQVVNEELAATANPDAIITFGIDTEPEHLSLAQSIDYVVVWCAKDINDFLVKYDKNMELQLSMAKKLDKIDTTTYEFEINPGIKFHNGREVKADDVKFSLEYIIDPESASGQSSYFTALDNVEVTGDYTGIIHLKEPYFSILNKLAAAPIIPKECADDLKTNPVGCGPYKFKEWNKDQDIQLVRFDDYWNKDCAAQNGGITFKIMKEYTTIHNAFVAGEIDAIMWSDFADVAMWDSMDGVYAQDNKLYDSFIAVYNTNCEPLADARVRRAIGLALDKQQMIDMTSFGFGEILDEPCYPGTFYYNDAASYSRNIDEAKALLAEAGYADGFTCTLLVPTTVQEGGCGDLMQAQLKELGIDAQLEKVEVGVFIDRVWGRKDFDICVTGDGSDGDPDNWLSRWIKTGADNNLGSYSNSELDELIAAGGRADTKEERKAHYDKAFEIINEEMPLTYLFGGHLATALHDNIQGFIMYTNWWADYYEMTKSE